MNFPRKVVHVFKYTPQELSEKLHAIQVRKYCGYKAISGFSRIPPEIWRIIFIFIVREFWDLFKLRRINREWKETCDYSIIWLENGLSFNLSDRDLRLYRPLLLHNVQFWLEQPAYIPVRTIQGLREFPLGLRFTIEILIEDDSGTIPLVDCISKYSANERESLAKLCQEHFISAYTQYSKHWSWFRKWHGWLVERHHYVRTWTFSDRLFHILYFAGMFELYLLIPCFTLPSSGNWLSVCGFAVSYLFLCQYYVLFLFFALDDLLQYLLNPVAVNDYLLWRWQVTVDSIIVYFLLSGIFFVALAQARVDSVVIVVFLWIFLLLFCSLTYFRHRKKRILQQAALGLGGEGNSPTTDAIIATCIVVLFLICFGVTLILTVNDYRIGISFIVPLLAVLALFAFLGFFSLFVLFLIPSKDREWFIILLAFYYFLCLCGTMYSSILLIVRSYHPLEDDNSLAFQSSFLWILLLNCLYGGSGTGLALMVVAGAAARG
jgi:hypothetical protein